MNYLWFEKNLKKVLYLKKFCLNCLLESREHSLSIAS